LGLEPALGTAYETLGSEIGKALSDPARRRVDGAIVQASGFSGIATGPCAIIFDEPWAALFIGGDTHHATKIMYEDVTRLQFTGRGLVQERSGLRWSGGGFGLGAATDGVLMAGALNALTSTTTTSVESLVSFAWSSSDLIILNERFLPQQLANILAPVLTRLAKVHPPADASSPGETGSLAAQLTELSRLHDAKALSDEEFSLAKSILLKPGV